jgi:hypothetical protein
MHHYWLHAVWTLLGIWAYCFIGVLVMRPLYPESKGMTDPGERFFLMILWPLLPVIFVVEKEL